MGGAAFSLPWGPMVTKKKKKKHSKGKKSKILKKRKILSGDMVSSYLCTTFGVNSHVSEKTRFTDGRMTDHERPRHGISYVALLSQSKRAKMQAACYTVLPVGRY